ncbi:MFS transporter [Komagataeibacter swingsii]|uniref:MFS transporter n=1 Tax=Komagataeibacter swingsii TaxID=215220 RepID=UPI00142DAA30|nr:MFS transporter [Komagataeibacter swingsii]
MASGAIGQFTDGYILGVVGTGIPSVSAALHLGPVWQGLVGAGALAGLFLGSLFASSLMDRIGRRPVFAFDMLVFFMLSVLQFFVSNAGELLFIRLVLGLALGVDYVVGKTYVSEYVPQKQRGTLMSCLGIAWIFGYTSAYVSGYFMLAIGPSAWRWIFASSAIPAIIGSCIRFRMPESALWLVEKGRTEKARAVLKRYFSCPIALPAPPVAESAKGYWGRVSQLFQGTQRRRTVAILVFYTCHNIPYFVLNTFLPSVMVDAHVRNPFLAGLIYNLVITVGVLFSAVLVNMLGRRSLAAGSLLVQSALLVPLVVLPHASPVVSLVLLCGFGFVLAASDSLSFVYPPEIFPTSLRAAGIGVTVAISRLTTTLHTLIFPQVLVLFGMKPTLAWFVITLGMAGFVCYRTAPETKDARLSGL